jgi:hypothetical protein
MDDAHHGLHHSIRVHHGRVASGKTPAAEERQGRALQLSRVQEFSV